MPSTISPNMNLIVPTVGQQPGPAFAFDVNASLTLVDQHDHSPGRGAQITPAGININATLPFNNNFASQVAGVTFTAQSLVPAIGTIYEFGNDLYFVDGVGNNIRLTQSGAIAGTPGSITGLVPPASVTYVPGNQSFVFQSNVNIAADLDAGALKMRNLSPNSTFALTLQPPAALVSNYTLTLPTIPAVQSFMTLDNAGQMAAPWTVDGVTIQIVGDQLVVQPQNLPNSDREHNYELNGPYGSSDLTYPLTNIDAIFLAPYNLEITSVWIYNGDAGSGGTTEYDLKLASPGGSYTTIMGTTGKITSAAAANIWTDSGSVVAPQTGVVKPVLSSNSMLAGQALRFDLITSMTGTPTDARIRIFYRQV